MGAGGGRVAQVSRVALQECKRRPGESIHLHLIYPTFTETRAACFQACKDTESTVPGPSTYSQIRLIRFIRKQANYKNVTVRGTASACSSVQ